MRTYYVENSVPLFGWHLCIGVGWDFARCVKPTAHWRRHRKGGGAGHVGIHCCWLFGWAHK